MQNPTKIPPGTKRVLDNLEQNALNNPISKSLKRDVMGNPVGNDLNNKVMGNSVGNKLHQNVMHGNTSIQNAVRRSPANIPAPANFGAKANYLLRRMKR